MKKVKWIRRLNLLRRLDALEARLAALEESGRIGEGGVLVAEAMEAGVPLSQVINEYLYGKEEGDA